MYDILKSISQVANYTPTNFTLALNSTTQMSALLEEAPKKYLFHFYLFLNFFK